MTKATEKNKRLLPRGWRWVNLGDIGAITDGDWILNADYAASGVRLLQVGDVGIGKFLGKSSRFVTKERAIELNCTFLQAGDILISRMPDPIGRACLLPDLGYNSITAVDVSIFRPDLSKAHPDFLIFYFSSTEWFNRVLSMASGATRARISRSNLQNLKIPLAPLADQKRIAGILSKQMAAVERARAAAEARLNNAKALTAAYLRQAFPNAGDKLPQGWRWVRIGDISEVATGGTPSTGHPEYYGGNIRWLKSADVKGMYIFEVPNRITELGIDNSNAKIHPAGSVMLAMSGQGKTRGTAAILRIPSACSQSVAAILPSKQAIPEIVYFALVLQYDNIRRITGDNERTGLNLKIIRNIGIPLPPLAEQQRIAGFLNKQMAAVENLQKAADFQLNEISALPSAILRQAFNGEI